MEMNLDTLYEIKTVEDPRINNDGELLAYTSTKAVKEINDYVTDINIYNLRNKKIVLTISDGSKNSSPRWNKNNCIAYIKSIKDNNSTINKLYICDIGTEINNYLIDLNKGVSDLQFSNCNNYISFLGYDVDDVNENSGFNDDALVIERFNWKSDSLGIIGNSYKHLYIYDLKNLTLNKLTKGHFDVGGYCWANNSQKIAYITNKSNNSEIERKKEIYTINKLDDSEHKKINTLEEMRGYDISYSPDDSLLAVSGHDNQKYGHYGFQKIWTINTKNQEKICVSSDIDISFGDYSRNYDIKYYGGNDKITWDNDGESLYALSNEKGYIYLNKINIYDRKLKRITNNNSSVIYGYTTDKNRRVFVTVETNSYDPSNLYIYKNNNREQITNINNDIISKYNFNKNEEIVLSKDGFNITGWMLESKKNSRNKKTPLILYNGGGPGGMRANVFVYEFHYYNQLGFSVINCNSRGNYGFGEEFSLAIKSKWGDLDVEDNINYLNHIIKIKGINKEHKLFTAGGSYGGYITSWMICNHPDLFSAAVVDRTVFNRASFFGTSDMGYHLDKIEHSNIMPWDDIMTYYNRSPVSQIHKVKTPTLVVHSEKDYRCTIDQGEQLYAALHLLGIKTKLLRFKYENHELSRLGKPRNKLIRMNEYLKWFNEYM
tara:strand:+ start:1104 stop:3080 length:1977 start_codon:yes stop_codon:yes gene_type:complete